MTSVPLRAVRVRVRTNASIGTVTLTAARMSENTIVASSATTTSLKLSMAVWTIAGAQSLTFAGLFEQQLPILVAPDAA